MEQFGYNSKVDFYDYLEIENIYDVCIEVMDADSLFYYLIISTDCGETDCITWGPLLDEDFIEDASIQFIKFKSSKTVIMKTIQKFLSPRKRSTNIKNLFGNIKTNTAKILSAQVISKEDAMLHASDIFRHFKGEQHEQ